jgi:Subtilase family/Peptidase inhibitor I9
LRRERTPRLIPLGGALIACPASIAIDVGEAVRRTVDATDLASSISARGDLRDLVAHINRLVATTTAIGVETQPTGEDSAEGRACRVGVHRCTNWDQSRTGAGRECREILLLRSRGVGVDTRGARFVGEAQTGPCFGGTNMPFSSKNRSTSRRSLMVLGITLALAVLTVSPAAGAPGSATAGSTQGSRNVIVVLRDQHTNLKIAKGKSSARVNAYRSDQASLITQARSHGVRNLRGFSAINGVSATVTAAQAAQLASDPSVARVFPDLAIRKAPTLTADAPSRARPVPATQSGVCPTDPAKPLLEPEALGVTNTAFDNPATPQAQNIVDGTGVKVAWIADGVDINNPDFIRADGSHVFVDYQDFSGDGLAAATGGAEAFGDASSIAAQGRQVYDLADFVNVAHPLPAGCNITIRGVAPGASMIGLKVFGNAPSAPTSRFIEAIDYAVAAGADVLNESFGGNPFPDTADDPITLADNAAIAAGVTVVSSTGDAGTTGTVGTPASSTGGVIGVAATTTFQSYQQETGGGAQLSNGTWISNNISGLSSGGVTQSGGVPDLAAPGDLGWALCTPDLDLYEECSDDNGNPASIQNFGGTSQSSPLTSGAAALVIEAYENTHHGVRPSPALVKRILTSTATDLGHPAAEQGSGLLNSLAAVRAAQSWHDSVATPAATGQALVVDKTQLKLSGDPGHSTPASLAVTNVSNRTQVVRGSTRSFEHIVKTVNGTADIDTATAPFYVDAFGIARSYVSTTFSVGHVDRLDVSEAAPTGTTFASRIILIDPSGAFAAYSIPQGAANFAHIDVRFPKAGTWTAYFALSQVSGFVGTFAFSVVQTDFSTHGTVSPSRIVLAPGQTGTFHVNTRVPTSPGDLSASVQFSSSGGVTTSVPMTLRAVVPAHNVTFSGTITGGNGRQQEAQSNVYFLNVPAGKKDLSIGVTFDDPGQLTFGYLTAPDGQVYSFQGNLADGGAVHVKYNTVNIHANLPTSAGTRLPAGVAVTVPVRIRNTGVAPITYFADGRLNTVGTIPLMELSGNSTDIPLPVPANVLPFWLVPTEVSQLNASATADQPVNMDFFFQSGDPDVYSPANGNGASVQVNARQVSPGIWLTDIGQTGPFSGPAPAGTLSVSASVQGQLFDPAVTTAAGDPWQLGVDPAANPVLAAQVRAAGQRVHAASAAGLSPAAAATPAAGTGPLMLNPGQTGTILVTITPTGAPGQVVRGNLYIDSFDFNLAEGDELIDLPYAYTVK